MTLFEKRDWAAGGLTLAMGGVMLAMQGLLIIQEVGKTSKPIQITFKTEQAIVEPPPVVIPPPVKPVKPVKPTEVKPTAKTVTPVPETAPPQIAAQTVSVPTAPPLATAASPAPAHPRLSNGESESAFLQDVRNRIERKKIYPATAKKLGMSGVVELVYVIDRSGRLISVEISKPSGFDLLDQAAVQAVKAATFDVMPEDGWLGESQKQFKTKVVFSLSN